MGFKRFFSPYDFFQKSALFLKYVVSCCSHISVRKREIIEDVAPHKLWHIQGTLAAGLPVLICNVAPPMGMWNMWAVSVPSSVCEERRGESSCSLEPFPGQVAPGDPELSPAAGGVTSVTVGALSGQAQSWDRIGAGLWCFLGARGSAQVLVQDCSCWVHYLKEKESQWVKSRQHNHSVWWQPAFVCCGNGGITLQHPLCVYLLSWSCIWWVLLRPVDKPFSCSAVWRLLRNIVTEQFS